MLVSERVGQFFFDSGSGSERLEYTEYGAGPHWVVLLHCQLMPRRMQQPLARALAAEGLHVVTLDLLGHGRSDRPADPLVYSMSAFGDQVVALLDHLGADQAVIGGTSLGANVSLEVAATAPARVKGLIVEMPVLDNALEAGIVAFVPIMFAARFAPFTVNGLRLLTRPIPRGLVPFWAGIALDTMDQRADSVAAILHGVIFGRVAPSSRQRRRITAPALDRRAPRATRSTRSRTAAMLAEELANAEFVAGHERARVAGAARAAERGGGRVRPALLADPAAQTPYRVLGRSGPPGTMAGCLSTATRRSCCAPTSWARPTASSPC